MKNLKLLISQIRGIFSYAFRLSNLQPLVHLSQIALL